MPANASISYSSSRFADIIGACLMVVSHVAHAAPPPDADMSLAPWFHSLTIPNTGSSCCGAADCRNYPVVVASDGYRVQFRGQWLKVPPSVVQMKHNTSGSAASMQSAAHVVGIITMRYRIDMPPRG